MLAMVDMMRVRGAILCHVRPAFTIIWAQIRSHTSTTALNSLQFVVVAVAVASLACALPPVAPSASLYLFQCFLFSAALGSPYEIARQNTLEVFFVLLHRCGGCFLCRASSSHTSGAMMMMRRATESPPPTAVFQAPAFDTLALCIQKHQAPLRLSSDPHVLFAYAWSGRH